MIRFLEERDIIECTKMLKEFYATDAVSHKIPEQNIQNTIDVALSGSPYIKIIICEMNGLHVGFCTLSFTYSTEAGGLVVLIEEIYIRDKFKGQGFGTDIFDFIRKKYDSKCKRYRLEVAENNFKAIKLYNKLNFEELNYKQMILDL